MRLPNKRYLANVDRVCHIDKEGNVHYITSARDDIQTVFNTYSSYAVCEKIIFNFNSNGNEGRHGVMHRFTGNKRVMFFRGLVSRAQLHTVLRYDKGVDAMLLVVLGECGLFKLNPSVLDSFKTPRRLRAHVAKRSSTPAVMKKRKYDAMLVRGQCSRDNKADGGPAYMSGQATFEDGALTHHLLKKKKLAGVRRCSRCKRQGHTKAKCTDSSAPIVDSKLLIPDLSVAEDLNSFRRSVLVFIDIETTSGSVYDLEVVQIAASAISWPDLKSLPTSTYNKFARNVRPVSSFVKKKLTAMNWDNLASMPPFKEVLEDFFSYLRRLGSACQSLILVAHNGKPFDLPALFNAAIDVDVDLFARLTSLKVVGLCDTLMVAHLNGGNKEICGLGALFEETSIYAQTSKPFIAHDASEDVDALIHIFVNNRRKQFSSLRRSTVANNVVIPIELMGRYCQAMKDDFEYSKKQSAVVADEESQSGFVPPSLMDSSQRPQANDSKKRISKTKKDVSKPRRRKKTKRRNQSALEDSPSASDNSNNDAEDLGDADNANNNNENVGDDVDVIHFFKDDAKANKHSTCSSVGTAPQPSQSQGTQNDDDVALTALLEPSLTKPQALVARQLRLCCQPIHLDGFIQSDGFISSKHNSSYDRLQDHLRDVMSLDSSTPVLECAKNFPVSAKSMLCLLERELDETTVVNFLNMDVINSFSAVLAARFPLCSITSTYVVVWALQDWTSMEIKCSRLLQIDFDNDNIFFPVHHPTASHWSLVRLHWTSACWDVYYVDSYFDQDVGDKYCDAVVTMVQAYLTTFRQVYADKAQIRGGKRVVVGRDQANMRKRATATFNRVVLTTSKQKDLFNCGCFMLHTIESVLANRRDWASFPESTEYFAAYRRRLLLTLFTFDGE